MKSINESSLQCNNNSNSGCNIQNDKTKTNARKDNFVDNQRSSSNKNNNINNNKKFFRTNAYTDTKYSNEKQE